MKKLFFHSIVLNEKEREKTRFSLFHFSTFGESFTSALDFSFCVSDWREKRRRAKTFAGFDKIN